jgi:cysteine/glycine-rich protein
MKNICVDCKEIGYMNEIIKLEDKVYHIKCFKCSFCKTKVHLGNFHSHGGKIKCYNIGKLFCKAHYSELFKKEGNFKNLIKEEVDFEELKKSNI